MCGPCRALFENWARPNGLGLVLGPIEALQYRSFQTLWSNAPQPSRLSTNKKRSSLSLLLLRTWTKTFYPLGLTFLQISGSIASWSGGGRHKSCRTTDGVKRQGRDIFYGEPLKLKLMLHSNFITACFFKFEFFQSSILKKKDFLSDLVLFKNGQ